MLPQQPDLPIPTSVLMHQATKSDLVNPRNKSNQPSLSQQMPTTTITTASPSQPIHQQAPSPYGHSNDQSMVRTTPAATKWHLTTHCPISTVPICKKHTIAYMHYKPHPSPSFLTLLHGYHTHKYCPL